MPEFQVVEVLLLSFAMKKVCISLTAIDTTSMKDNSLKFHAFKNPVLSISNVMIPLLTAKIKYL